MNFVQQRVDVYTLVGVRPVFDVDLALLHVERVVGHVERTRRVKVASEHPQDATIAADVDAEVPRVGDVVELVSTAEEKTFALTESGRP